MRIEVRHADDIRPGEDLAAHHDLAVVIDVLRAFTVAPWLLRRGASRVLLAPDAATTLRASAGVPDALLSKDGAPDVRFDLPNAPGLVAGLDLTGRTVVQATGNGTRGAHLVRDVPEVACASFTTASATARLVRRFERVLLVPTEGDEDHALAELLVALAGGVDPDVATLLRRVVDSPAGVECRERAGDDAFPGVHPDDLALCCRVDAYDHALLTVPRGAPS